MDFEITTFVSAGPIRFGMTQEEVRQLLPGPMRSFKRVPSEPLPSDQFTELGVIVYYKQPGIVEAIEFSRPSNPIFRGLAFFSTTVEQAEAFVESKDSNLEVDGAGFTSHVLGVGVYALEGDPDENEPSELVSVIAFEEGYYSKST